MNEKYLVILFGPPAVGKMTVGYELAKQTGFKLFHNHLTIDLLLNIFQFDTQEFTTLNTDIRYRIMEEFARSDTGRGIIFTCTWILDDPNDRQIIDSYKELFTKAGGKTYYVELEASLAARKARNVTEFRLSKKESKRDITLSDTLLNQAANRKMNSADDFFYKDNYLKINNETKSSEETARQIIEFFNLDTHR